MDVLGISAFTGPAAACLVRDGRILAAAREDIFTRVHEDRAFPSNAIAYCLRAGKVGAPGLAAAWFAGTLDARVPRTGYSERAARVSSFGQRVAHWLGKNTSLRELIARELDPELRLGACDPTAAEAAAAYLGSPFGDAAVLVLDEGRASCALGHAGGIESLDAIPFDGSLASLFTEARRHAGADAICFGGTGARDRAANGAVLRSTNGPLWMNPAAGAGAAAIGAAILGARECARADGELAIRMGSAAIGPAYNAAQIRTFLRSQGIVRDEAGRDEAPADAAARLEAGSRVVWVEGRLDFDDDAAGSRSVIRSASPAAPPNPRAGEVVAVAAERAAEIFEVEGTCPPLIDAPVRAAWRAFLAPSADALRALPIAPIAAEHRGFRALLSAMEQRTGSPAVITRALRLPSGPIAAAPHDAWAAREHVDASMMVMGPYVLDESLTKSGASREIADPTPSSRSSE